MSLRRYYNEAEHIPSDYVVIDCETSGLDACTCEILEICAIKYKDDNEIATFHTYVRPIGTIQVEATAVNGITWKMVCDAPILDEIRPRLLQFLGDSVLVGHNVGFDIKFLQTRLGVNLPNPCFDTLSWSRHAFPQYADYRLDYLRRKLRLGGTAHSAEGDCIATHNLMERIKRSNAALRHEMKLKGERTEFEQKQKEYLAQEMEKRARIEQERDRIKSRIVEVHGHEPTRSELIAISQQMEVTDSGDYMAVVLDILASQGRARDHISKGEKYNYDYLRYGWAEFFGIKYEGQLKYIVLQIPPDQIDCDFICTLAAKNEGDYGARIFVRSPADLKSLSAYITQSFDGAASRVSVGSNM